MEKTHFTSDPPQRIGQRIRNERSKWNLTQEQLSEHLGISTNYLGQIERGRSFSHALAERFCEFFHITYDYLYYGTEPSKEYTPSETDGELEHLLQSCTPEEKRLCLHILKEVLTELRSFRRGSEASPPSAPTDRAGGGD